MSSHHEELEMLAWPDPLGPGWEIEEHDNPAGLTYEVTFNGEGRGSIRVERALRSKVRNAYPAGEHDRFLSVSDDATAEALQLASETIWSKNPQCRRLVIATPDGDIAEISRAEKSGYRYVVDVDLPGDEEVSLLVAEPHWVLEESRNIDVVPTR